GIRVRTVTGVQTCALPIYVHRRPRPGHDHPPRALQIAMAEKKKTDTESKTAETEKGFGTGLRAQLARRRDGGPLEPPAASPRRAASEGAEPAEEVELVEAPVSTESAKRADTPLLDAAADELDALRT